MKKWTANYVTSATSQQSSIPNTISHSTKHSTHSDDRSIGSISTINTRMNSIEGHYKELSGTMEHIKEMLNLIANPKTSQVEDPKSYDSAGQRKLAGDPS